jgi:hypothetical protein
MESLKKALIEALGRAGWMVDRTEGWSNKDGSITVVVTVKKEGRRSV